MQRLTTVAKKGGAGAVAVVIAEGKWGRGERVAVRWSRGGG